MKREAKLLFKVSRPVLWLWFAFPFFAGLLIGGVEQVTLLMRLEFLALGPLYGLVVYGVNDVYDYETDKVNERKGSGHGEILEPENHRFILTASAVASVLLVSITFLTGNLVNIAGMILLLLFAAVYSVPPARLKARAPLDSIANGVAYILIPASMGYSFGSAVTSLPLEAYWLAFATVGLHSATTLMDYKADKNAGIQTFAVRFGKKKTSLFSVAVLGITLLFSSIDSLIANFILLQLFLGIGLMTLDAFNYRELPASIRDKLIILVYAEGVVLGIYYLVTHSTAF